MFQVRLRTSTSSGTQNSTEPQLCKTLIAKYRSESRDFSVRLVDSRGLSPCISPFQSQINKHRASLITKATGVCNHRQSRQLSLRWSIAGIHCCLSFQNALPYRSLMFLKQRSTDPSRNRLRNQLPINTLSFAQSAPTRGLWSRTHWKRWKRKFDGITDRNRDVSTSLVWTSIGCRRSSTFAL